MSYENRLRRSTKVKVEFEGIVLNYISSGDGSEDGYRISVKDPTPGGSSWWATVPANCVKEIQ